jgi:hypothetical protein
MPALSVDNVHLVSGAIAESLIFLRPFERFAIERPDLARAPQCIYLVIMSVFHVLKCCTRNPESEATMQALIGVGLVELQ